MTAEIQMPPKGSHSRAYRHKHYPERIICCSCGKQIARQEADGVYLPQGMYLHPAEVGLWVPSPRTCRLAKAGRPHLYSKRAEGAIIRTTCPSCGSIQFIEDTNTGGQRT
jgi:ribosomal protein S27E